MYRFSLAAFFSLFFMVALTACFDKKEVAQAKVEQPIVLDQFGNEVIYTAEGEKELIDEDCD
ncbi:MAG: hypothetical protein KAG20_03940 [Cocleimonas sp.]|nr:hypothetical protein [Cocleimonas sp.]